MLEKYFIEELDKMDDVKELQHLAEQLSILTMLESKLRLGCAFGTLGVMIGVLIWHVLCTPFNTGWIVSGLVFIWLITTAIRNIIYYTKWCKLLRKINSCALFDGEDAELLYVEMIEELSNNRILPALYANYVKRDR